MSNCSVLSCDLAHGLLEILTTMLEILFSWDEDHLPEDKGKLVVQRRNVGEFFSLIAGLLHLISIHGIESKEKKMAVELRIAREASKQLYYHRFCENLGHESTDYAFIGLLHLIFVLILHSPLNLETICSNFYELSGKKFSLVHFLYCQCLFAESKERDENRKEQPNEIFPALGPNCKTEESRSATYALLVQMISAPSQGQALLEELLSYMKKRRKIPQDVTQNEAEIVLFGDMSWKWDYDPASLLKEGGLPGGLINLSATCYLNSVLQQLYHTSDFSNQLLAINIGLDPLNRDENQELLLKMQVLFASLKVNQRRYHDTLPFCKAFMDYDGNPMRVNEQKDAYEFCIMLIEKLERTGPKAQRLIQKVFGGMLQYQTFPNDCTCTHTSSNEDPFLIITADIQGKDSLSEGLDLFTKFESFDGDNKYECSRCMKYVKAKRRCAIKDLPPTLIIHLKRFEFNLETMTRHKLNHRCSFPILLDMEPWTVEGIEKRESNGNIPRSQSQTASLNDDVAHKDDYGDFLTSSVGAGVPEMVLDETILSAKEESVLQKSFLANNKGRLPGYYKYKLQGVLAHIGSAESGHYYSFIRSDENGTWLEINDKIVTPFDEANIPKECFGGSDASSDSKNNYSRTRNNNAYMLFYERIEKGSFVDDKSEGSSVDLESPEDEEVVEINDASFKVNGHPPLCRNPDKVDLSAKKVNDSKTTMGSVDWLHVMNEVKEKKKLKGPEMAHEVVALIAEENSTLFIDTHQFHPDFLRLAWSCLELGLNQPTHLPTSISCVQVGLRVMTEVLIRSKARGAINDWSKKLEEFVELDCEIAEQFLRTLSLGKEGMMSGGVYQQCPWIYSALQECPYIETRARFAEMVIFAIQKARLPSKGVQSVLSGCLEMLEMSSIRVRSGHRSSIVIVPMLRVLLEGCGVLGGGAREAVYEQNGVKIVSEVWGYSDKIGCLLKKSDNKAMNSGKSNICTEIEPMKEGTKLAVALISKILGDVALEQGEVLPSDTCATLLESNLISKHIADYPEEIGTIAAKMVFGYSIDGTVSSEVFASLKDLVFLGAASPAFECGKTMAPYLVSLECLFMVRDGQEGERAKAILSWMLPCIQSVLERRSQSGGSPKITSDEAKVIETVCCILLKAHAQCPKARPAIDEHRSEWEYWAKVVESSVNARFQAGESRGSILSFRHANTNTN
eukprot:CAMPEP_0171455010 /NCGR_PEP_ID=MMETSP0945-20130129/2074_1 /TAXON_ID=109269 /ORGANISM="Vaucheria litorea, Strain CCMP2940" /LENGTH=1188 /DNA_ID=CAMNT_0011980161 /DNA_START=261 /DNA_END=3827 /DNA_ORIENTATION=+